MSLIGPRDLLTFFYLDWAQDSNWSILSILWQVKKNTNGLLTPNAIMFLSTLSKSTKIHIQAALIQQLYEYTGLKNHLQHFSCSSKHCPILVIFGNNIM